MGERIGKGKGFLFVVLSGLFITGIILILNILSFSKIQDGLVSQVTETQLVEVQRAASQIESHIIQVRDELLTLSKLPVLESLAIEGCKKGEGGIHGRIPGIIESLVRVNEQGDAVACSSPSLSYFDGLNIKNKNYFKIPKNTSEAYISGLESLGQNQIIVVAAPVLESSAYQRNLNGKNFHGVLLSIIRIPSLYSSFIHPIIDPKGESVIMVNAETNETILEIGSVANFTQIKDVLPLNDRLFSLTAYLPEGRAVVTGSDLIVGSERWQLILMTPEKNIGRELASTQRRNAFSLGFVFLTIVGVSFFIISINKKKEDVQSRLEKVHGVLERLGINLDVEKERFAQTDIVLEPGRVYLIKQDDENQAHELFLGTLNRGFAGLGMLREDPRLFKKRYNLEKTSCVWITKTPIPDVPCESDPGTILQIIKEFISSTAKSIVLLEHFDYLALEKSFEEVVHLLHNLKDVVAGRESIILVSLNPALIEERKRKAIEAELVDIFGAPPSGHLEAEDISLLKFVNDKNAGNLIVSYKDISKFLNITKPTTRARLSNMISLGLFQVEKKGRTKTVKITSKGRRLVR